VKVPMPPTHPGEFLAEILEDTVLGEGTNVKDRCENT
jgi:hypothetical protein